MHGVGGKVVAFIAVCKIKREALVMVNWDFIPCRSFIQRRMLYSNA